MDDRLGVGLGLPAIGDDENFGMRERKRVGIGPEFLSRRAPDRGRAFGGDVRIRLAGCRPLRRSFIGGDDPRHQFVADDVLGGEFHLGDALDAVEQPRRFGQTRGLAVRQVDLARDRR